MQLSTSLEVLSCCENVVVTVFSWFDSQKGNWLNPETQTLNVTRGFIVFYERNLVQMTQE